MAETVLPAVPMTLLDAVNMLLASVGISEVDSLLDADSNKDSRKAFRRLNNANAEIQSMGWYCNTENMKLAPNAGGDIEIPQNFLMVRPQRNTATFLKRIGVRGAEPRKLYNLTDSTFTWTDSVDVEVVQSLAFEDLPQALRWYITCRAGRMFAIGTYPSAGTFRFTQEEEAMAKAQALQEDEMNRDSILPETSPHFGRMRKR